MIEYLHPTGSGLALLCSEPAGRYDSRALDGAVDAPACLVLVVLGASLLAQVLRGPVRRITHCGQSGEVALSVAQRDAAGCGAASCARLA
jgi:hypothetical protein